MKFQSNSYSLPIPILLLAGYFVGIYYPLVIHYHDFLGDFLVGSSHEYSIAFFIGLLGATTQLSIGFAMDINKRTLKPDDYIMPSYYEPFGYLLKQIWGGITAVIFILATKQGFLAAFEMTGAMEMEAVIVIAFVVGLRAFAILKYISKILKIDPAAKNAPKMPPANQEPATPEIKSVKKK